jgi:DNA modification methylase
MQIALSTIHFPASVRLRSETYGEITELATSLRYFGQLAPILVRRPDPDTYEEDRTPEAKDKEWVIVDGGRRFLASVFMTKTSPDNYTRKTDPGFIEAIEMTDDRLADPVHALSLEFHANEDREDFSWKEKADYVRRVHEIFTDRYPDDWDVKQTAEFLRMGQQTAYKYLQLTEDPDILEDERVSGASTFRSAHKQATIAKEHKRRKRAVKIAEEVRAKTDDVRFSDTEKFARQIVAQGDCREWIADLKDEMYEWIHWDPPYGGEQSGGAEPTHSKIDDSAPYARGLMEDMFPELHRVLKPGRWMVIWFHPHNYWWLRNKLTGHVPQHMKGVNGVLECRYCKEPWSPFSLADVCPKSDRPKFWVNPYPFIWYKQNRVADGHEIRRFLTNSYESFLLAAKVGGSEEVEPILQVNQRQNVLVYDSLAKSERRHVMHKSPELLTEILRLISIPGEAGIDPSVGSGSILEAAWSSGRRGFGCELSEEYWLGAVEAVKNTIEALAGVKE